MHIFTIILFEFASVSVFTKYRVRDKLFPFQYFYALVCLDAKSNH